MSATCSCKIGRGFFKYGEKNLRFRKFVVPENIHTPPHGWSMENPRGWRGGLKEEIFEGYGGLGTRKFSGGINVANRTTQTYGKYFDLQCP